MTSSTINPAIPASNSPVASAPMRSQFQAAANDINTIYGLLANNVLPTIAGLRANNTSPSQIYVQGYNAPGDTGGGPFWLNSGDTTSADNGITIFVDAVGNRWYRISDYISPMMGGAYGNGTNDDTPAVLLADSVVGINKTLIIDFTFKITSTHSLVSNLSFTGSGQLTVTTGHTLTYEGFIDAPADMHVFAGLGAHQFITEQPQKVQAGWFGILGLAPGAALQAAINSCPSGGGEALGLNKGGWTIYLPSGFFDIGDLTPTNGCLLDINGRRISLQGTGCRPGSNGTIIYWSDPNITAFDAATNLVDTLSMRDIQFQGAGQFTGTGNALNLGRAAIGAYDSIIEDCWFVSIPNIGILAANVGDYSIINTVFENSTGGISFTGEGTSDYNKIIGCGFFDMNFGIKAGPQWSYNLIENNSFVQCGDSATNANSAISIVNTSSTADTQSLSNQIIGNNFEGSSTNDIWINGAGAPFPQTNTGVNGTSIIGNMSKGANRRFLGLDAEAGSFVLDNTIIDANQTQSIFPAIELIGASDSCSIRNNINRLLSAPTFQVNEGLIISATATNVGLGPNDFVGAIQPILVSAGATLAAGSNAVVDMTLVNSWADVGGGFHSAAVINGGLGSISLVGQITGGSTGSTAFTLPTWARPNNPRRIAVATSVGAAYLTINTNGTVVPTFSGSPTWLALDGISFPLITP